MRFSLVAHRVCVWWRDTVSLVFGLWHPYNY